MAKKMKRSTTEDESSSSTASSSDDISREEAARHRRRRQARKNAKKKERSYTQGKDEILSFLVDIKEEVYKQSKQVTESVKEEMYKQLEKIREEMSQQSKQVTESKEEMCKHLEKVKQDINQELHKQLTEILTDQRKQWGSHTNGSSGDDSYAPRSQSNQVPPPRYRLVFKSGVTDRIEKGQIIDISVALIDGSNGQTVENGPLASATVELVVVNAEFNQHNNQYNWSREDFESNIKKPQEKYSATGEVDQSVKSIVSNGQFNLVHGVRCHSGSKIFSNSGNKKVRLGVMVVSQTEERVLEALSDPFYVRGHDRPARQSNSRHNRSNTQKEALDCNNGYQEQNGPMPNMQNPSWTNPTQAGGRIRQTLENSYQVQNGQMPNLQNSLLPNSTQTGEIRFNRTTSLQLPFPGDTTMPPAGLNINEEQQLPFINEEQQLPFIGNTTMHSAEPSTINQEQRASIQYHNFPHLPTVSQATNNQIVSPSSTLVGHFRNPNYMGNSHISVDEVDMQFIMDQRVLPVQLLWDRSNVEPIKRRWNLFDQLNTSPKEHFGSMSSLASKQKSVLDTRHRSGGVLIEPLEPDDSDQERPLRSRRQPQYQLQFVNKVCEAYYTRDQIKADDGNLLMVALFDENNTRITSGPLSSASVEVVALHGDFNVNAQDYWTSEEFSRSIVCPPPGEEASSVLGGDRTLVLAGGEACVAGAFFQRTSLCARTAKFKMGVRLLPSAHEETIQEGISEPFRVIDRHVEGKVYQDGPGNSECQMQVWTGSKDSSKNATDTSTFVTKMSLPETEILESSKIREFTFSELENITRNFRPDSLLRKGGFGSVYKMSLPETEILESSKIREFTFSELENITRNFRPDSLLREGGFGSVYKGWIDEPTLSLVKSGTGMFVAVKKLKHDSFQGRREWLAEVNYLGQLSHPNIVKLIGYCSEDEQRILVYEYMPGGTLEDHLFGRRSNFQPLPWNLRIKIAAEMASALLFLHSRDQAKVIYRDLKPANVLLDSEFVAKLADFGLAKDGTTGDVSHVPTIGTWTPGYIAPEYLATGHLTVKIDVYSFGVVLLELMCGRRALDKNRPPDQHNLVEWARPYIINKRVIDVLDSRLGSQYSLPAAEKMADLALQCLSMDARCRPGMDQAVTVLDELQEAKGQYRMGSNDLATVKNVKFK